MPEWFDQWPRMTRAELPRYVAMVREAAEEAPVRLKLGIEADYFPGTESYVEEMLGEWPFEFVLGSVHILNPQYRERFGHLRAEELIERIMTETHEESIREQERFLKDGLCAACGQRPIRGQGEAGRLIAPRAARSVNR